MADDSDSELAVLAFVYSQLPRESSKRRFWIHDVIRKRSELGEYHRLVQELRLDSTRFQQYFRMTPTKFDELLSLVGPLIQREDTSFRKAIEPGQRLAITIR